MIAVALDETLAKTTTNLRLPPLAVGMGMYLPAALTLMIPIGAFLGRIYDSWARWSGDDDERKKRLGVMLATGLIVGESLYGVLFAVIVATTGKEEPLAMVRRRIQVCLPAAGSHRLCRPPRLALPAHPGHSVVPAGSAGRQLQATARFAWVTALRPRGPAFHSNFTVDIHLGSQLCEAA